MTISKEKVDLILAEKRLSVTELCKTAGFSRNRFYTVMNNKRVTPKTVGRFAEALEASKGGRKHDRQNQSILREPERAPGSNKAATAYDSVV